MDSFFTKKFSNIPSGLTSIYNPQHNYQDTGLRKHKEHTTLLADEIHALASGAGGQSGVYYLECTDDNGCFFKILSWDGEDEIVVLLATFKTNPDNSITNNYTPVGTVNCCTDAVADTTPPSIAARTPDHQEVDVSESLNQVEIIFTEPIQLKVGNIEVYNHDTLTVVKTYDVATSTDIENFNGNTLRFKNLSFTPGVNYSVVIPAGSINDFADNDFGSIAQGAYTFLIETVDTVAPSQVLLSPLHNSSDVAETDEISITFDEEVVFASGQIEIVNTATGIPIKVYIPTSPDIALQDFNTKVRFLNTGIQEGDTYFIRIPAGAITDTSGNAFTGIADGAWQFVMVDNSDVTAPLVGSSFPVHLGETDHTSYFSLTFGESVQLHTSIDIKLRKESDDSLVYDYAIVDLVPTHLNKTLHLTGHTVVDGETYYIEIDGSSIKDTSGNFFAGYAANEWQFTMNSSVILDHSPALWIDMQDDATVQRSNGTLNAVMRLMDKSGNENHAHNITGANEPYYNPIGWNGSKPYLEFTNKYLSLPELSSGVDSYAIFAVVNTNWNSGDPYFLDAEDGRLVIGANGGNYRYAYDGVGQSGGAITTGNQQIGWIVDSPGSIYLNGAVSGSGLSYVPVEFTGEIRLGARYNFADQWLGNVAEIVIVVGTITNTAREEIEGYLAHKWGLEGDLPGAHPYKASPPA